MVVIPIIYLFEKSPKGDIELKFWQKFLFFQNQVIKFHPFWVEGGSGECQHRYIW
jgi:hypothetical protein